jgi:dipeptidyl aminopeptidase/acylaminoacyl peptidase
VFHDLRRWPVQVLCVLLAAGCALLVLRILWGSYRGARSDFERNTCAEFAHHPERTAIAGLREVSFIGGSGERLAAWYVPSRNRAAVILVHGTNAERSSLLDEARLLAAAGFGVLALDLPGQGLSAGHTTWGEGERLAVGAALGWLASREEIDPARIGAFGLSFGGYVLLQAAARDPRIRAVVLASTPEDLDAETRRANARFGLLSRLPALWVLHRRRGSVDELPPSAAVRALAPRAVLIVGGERDCMVPPPAARALFEAAAEPKQLWIVPGAGHAGFSTAAPQAYAERLAGFFAVALGGDPGRP